MQGRSSPFSKWTGTAPLMSLAVMTRGIFSSSKVLTCQPFFHTVHNHDPFLRHGGTGKMQNFFSQEKIQTFFGGMTGGNHGSDNRAGTGARDDIGTEACFIHGLYDSDVGEAPGSTAAEHQS